VRSRQPSRAALKPSINGQKNSGAACQAPRQRRMTRTSAKKWLPAGTDKHHLHFEGRSSTLNDDRQPLTPAQRPVPEVFFWRTQPIRRNGFRYNALIEGLSNQHAGDSHAPRIDQPLMDPRRRRPPFGTVAPRCIGPRDSSKTQADAKGYRLTQVVLANRTNEERAAYRAIQQVTGNPRSGQGWAPASLSGLWRRRSVVSKIYVAARGPVAFTVYRA
jgi:hypothetical protein